MSADDDVLTDDKRHARNREIMAGDYAMVGGKLYIVEEAEGLDKRPRDRWNATLRRPAP